MQITLNRAYSLTAISVQITLHPKQTASLQPRPTPAHLRQRRCWAVVIAASSSASPAAARSRQKWQERAPGKCSNPGIKGGGEVLMAGDSWRMHTYWLDGCTCGFPCSRLACVPGWFQCGRGVMIGWRAGAAWQANPGLRDCRWPLPASRWGSPFPVHTQLQMATPAQHVRLSRHLHHQRQVVRPCMPWAGRGVCHGVGVGYATGLLLCWLGGTG